MKTGKLSKPLMLFLLLFTLTFTHFSGAEAAANIKTIETLKGGKWVREGGYYRYHLANGGYAKGGFKKIGKKWFYFSAKGNMLTGLHKLKGKLFYFQKTGQAGTIGQMKTGIVKIKGQTYYFRESGAVGVKGSAVAGAWSTVNGTKMYFTENGTKNEDAFTSNEAFIAKIGELARKDMKSSGILASVTVAQAILESGYGTSSLALEAHNLFGMKAALSGNTWKSAWTGKIYRKKTWEVYSGKYVEIYADFRAYNTYAESLADHSAYLLGAMNGTKLRYEGVKGNKSYRNTIKLIKNGGYATDPLYVSKIVSLIKKYKLTQFDKKAKKKN